MRLQHAGNSNLYNGWKGMKFSWSVVFREKEQFSFIQEKAHSYQINFGEKYKITGCKIVFLLLRICATSNKCN